MASGNLTPLINALSQEHSDLLAEIEKLAEEATAGLSDLKRAVESAASKLGWPLDEHIANEDRVLFPAYASAGGDAGILAFFTEEHGEILSLRDRLLGAVEDASAEEDIPSLVAELTDKLSSHIGREEEMVFPAMREVL